MKNEHGHGLCWMSMGRKKRTHTHTPTGLSSCKYEKKGTHGVGLAVRESIVARVEKGGLVVECISARLMKVRIQLEGKSNGVSFVVGYAPALGLLARETDHFRNALDSVVTGVPSGDHPFVLMDANARTGKRQSECADSKVLGKYGRDELNDNGERLLHAADNKLALLIAFFATPNRGVSYVHVPISKLWKWAVSARVHTYTTS